MDLDFKNNVSVCISRATEYAFLNVYSNTHIYNKLYELSIPLYDLETNIDIIDEYDDIIDNMSAQILIMDISSSEYDIYAKFINYLHEHKSDIINTSKTDVHNQMIWIYPTM